MSPRYIYSFSRVAALLVIAALHALAGSARHPFSCKEGTLEKPTTYQESNSATDTYTKDSKAAVWDSKPTRRTTNSSGKKTCKVIPSDATWPSQSSWSKLGSLTAAAGGLIKTVPSAAACYNGDYYNATLCAQITAAWGDSDFHDQDPTSIMSPFFEGASCMPTTDPTKSCTLGGYPNYAVKATTVADVQLAVNFARDANLRLVVKNTGHDFSGKSSGANSISVWTHYFKDILFIPAYKSSEYSGPAFKIGSGVQGFEIYKAAFEKGLVVIGGEGMTVGYAGGYLQGGGHSPLSSVYGMGSDHVLEFEVVTADGRFVTASASQNEDLFWALRGGGGSTFGVVTSAVVKAHPDLPVTTVTFDFTTPSTADFWTAVKSYLTTFPTMVDAGVYGYFNIFPGHVFQMMPLFGPNLTASQTATLLEPLYKTLNELNIPYTPKTTTYTSFYTAWLSNFPKEHIGDATLQLGSRLFPRENFSNLKKFNGTFEAIKSVIETSQRLIAFNVAPTLKAGGMQDTAVNPAWRETVLHAMTATGWEENASEEVIKEKRRVFTFETLKKWRDVTPGSGAYLGESDINEPDFQQAFWGTKYPRLYQLKQKYDPSGVFYASTAVGSEDWSLDGEGRLCRL